MGREPAAVGPDWSDQKESEMDWVAAASAPRVEASGQRAEEPG